jgi:hypothetical protein
MSTGGHDLDDHAKEGYKRVRAEADAARLANDPAAAKPGLFARWRTRRYRHAAEQLDAKASTLSAQDQAANRAEDRQSREVQSAERSYINPDRQFRDH